MQTHRQLVKSGKAGIPGSRFLKGANLMAAIKKDQPLKLKIISERSRDRT